MLKPSLGCFSGQPVCFLLHADTLNWRFPCALRGSDAGPLMNHWSSRPERAMTLERMPSNFHTESNMMEKWAAQYRMGAATYQIVSILPWNESLSRWEFSPLIASDSSQGSVNYDNLSHLLLVGVQMIDLAAPPLWPPSPRGLSEVKHNSIFLSM